MGALAGVVSGVAVPPFLPFWRWSPLLPTVQSTGPPWLGWPSVTAGFTSSQPWPLLCGSALSVASAVGVASVGVSVAVAVSVGVAVAKFLPFCR